MRQILIAVAIALTVSILLTPALIRLFTKQGFGHQIRGSVVVEPWGVSVQSMEAPTLALSPLGQVILGTGWLVSAANWAATLDSTSLWDTSGVPPIEMLPLQALIKVAKANPAARNRAARVSFMGGECN